MSEVASVNGVKGGDLNVCVFACRAFPACRALRLEEDQRPAGKHGRLPARSAALDHQRRFHQSARRLQVSEMRLRKKKM